MQLEVRGTSKIYSGSLAEKIEGDFKFYYRSIYLNSCTCHCWPQG
jgi:hypothetical protein